MAFDDKGFPIFPSRDGGSIGASLENRMLDIVGGAQGIRTRIQTLPDGSTVMLRTRGGMPEFTMSSSPKKVDALTYTYFFSKNITPVYPAEPFSYTNPPLYPRGIHDNIVDVFRNSNTGKFSRSPYAPADGGWAAVLPMFSSTYPKLPAFVVDGVVYIGNKYHGLVTVNAGIVYIDGVSTGAGAAETPPSPNTHLFRLNTVSTNISVPGGLLKNTAVVTDLSTGRFMYDWVNYTQADVTYICDDGTRYIITWDVPNRVHDNTYASFPYTIKIFAERNAPTAYGASTTKHTVLDTSVPATAIDYTSYRCTYVHPSPNNKKLCLEMYWTDENPPNIRTLAVLTDVYEIVLSGGDATTPPSAAITLRDSVQNDYEENGDELIVPPSNHCSVYTSYSAGTITFGCGTDAERGSGFTAYQEISNLLGAAYWDSDDLQIARYKYRRDTELMFSGVTPVTVVIPQNAQGEATTAVDTTVTLPKLPSASPAFGDQTVVSGASVAGPNTVCVGATHDVHYAIEVGGSVVAEAADVRIEYYYKAYTPYYYHVQVAVGEAWQNPPGPVKDAGLLIDPVPDGYSTYPVGSAKSQVVFYRTSNNTLLMRYQASMTSATGIEGFVLATIGGPAYGYVGTNPCALEKPYTYRACANPATGEISYALNSTWC